MGLSAPTICPLPEHEYGPKFTGVVAAPTQMSIPATPNDAVVEHPRLVPRSIREERVCPVSEWSPQPLAKRDSKAAPRAIPRIAHA